MAARRRVQGLLKSKEYAGGSEYTYCSSRIEAAYLDPNDNSVGSMSRPCKLFSIMIASLALYSWRSRLVRLHLLINVLLVLKPLTVLILPHWLVPSLGPHHP
jgi:hypothetical protein